jgi:Carbohydrate binding module (family 6)/alpha/beta hydrolase fold
MRRLSSQVSRWSASAIALVVLAFAVVAVPAAAAENPYQRGPDPTRESVAASRGTFATTAVQVPRGNGFGGGVIYYPSDTSQGTFGAVAMAPGYTASWNAEGAWMGHWVASFGFVVIGIDTLTPTDGAPERATQLLAALDYLTGQSAVRTRVDPSRLAVSGHSAGAGGSLRAALTRPSLKTTIQLAPLSPPEIAADLRVPELLMMGQNDNPANARSIYNTTPATTEKAYLELAGAGHGFPTSANSVMTRKVIPWLKLFVDNDARYSQFLCPLMDPTGINAYLSTCPLIPGAPTPTPTRYEAENSPAVCTGTIDSNYPGFTGTGFCNGNNVAGAYAQFTVDAAAAGTAMIRLRFANGTTAARPATLIVNGATVQTSSFESTGAWNTWVTKTLTVPLNAGGNTIRLNPTTSAGLPNIDHLDTGAA